MNRALVYATGGLAYGETEHSVTMFGPTGNVQFAGERKKTEVGFTAGGGAEYALTNHVSAKAEYLYYDLGKNIVDVAVIPEAAALVPGITRASRIAAIWSESDLTTAFNKPNKTGRWNAQKFLAPL